jgi:poly-gamma-glutamate capsule biosynthesis protein CapA/YwtB (metallophosphatase superfamily)
MKKIALSMALWLAGLHAWANDNIRMVFVGDMMLAETVGQVMRRGGNPLQHVAHLFKGADVTIGNLETAVGTHGEKAPKPYTFLAHPRVIPFLKRHFSAVSLANNHSLDFGVPAFEAMLDAFDRQGLRYFGGGKNIRSAHEPAVFEIKGKRIAVLGYDIFQPRSFEALHDKAGVAWGEPDHIAQDISRTRQHHRADVVIIYPHWGWENEKKGNSQQQALAHWMIDSGADAVVGGHPHVTQNIEVYKGKPIFYSLGNFIFNGFTDKESNTGWVLTLNIGPASEMDWTIHQVGLNRQGLPTDQGPVPKPLP